MVGKLETQLTAVDVAARVNGVARSNGALEVRVGGVSRKVSTAIGSAEMHILVESFAGTQTRNPPSHVVVGEGGGHVVIGNGGGGGSSRSGGGSGDGRKGGVSGVKVNVLAV